MIQRSTRSWDFSRKLVVHGVKTPSKSPRDIHLTNFYHADLELRNISNELDSFDGKKDPIRCNLLVNQLRTAQDKVISIIFQLMDECRCQRAPRDYRMKFPDEILLSEGSESLNGQIWFGAECLSAGSNILNHVKESTLLRPMAKKLTSNLDQLRRDLRQLVSNGGDGNWITDDLLVLMGEFDKVFAAFEYDYVRTMLPIRTVSEIERLQEVAVLFSETLIDSVKRGLLKQEEIEEFQPIVMIAIPRLAIVRGLLCSNENPIYSKHKSHMCNLFQPFHGPLQAIRRLLRNLQPIELLTLEKMLANDQGASLVDEQNDTQDKDIVCSDKKYNYGDNLQHEVDYNRVLIDNLQYPSGYKSSAARPEQVDEPLNIPYSTLHTSASASTSLRILEPTSSRINQIDSTLSTPSSPRYDNHPSTVTPDTSLDNRPQDDGSACSFMNSDIDSQLQKLMAEFNPQMTINSEELVYKNLDISQVEESKINNSKSDIEESSYQDKSNQSGQSTVIQQLFVKQAQQLLHRMFVAIAGVADQLQSNFASDLRFILRNIFINESDQEESDNESSISSATIEEGIEAEEITNLIDLEQSPCERIQDIGIPIDDQTILRPTPVSNITSSVIAVTSGRRRSCNCDSDSDLQNTNQASSVYTAVRNNPPTLGQHSVLCRCRVCLQSSGNINSSDGEQQTTRSTPRRRSREHGESRSRNSGSVNSRRALHQVPPVWVPDELVVACLSCNASFTFFRRRHHCRSCGQIFCSECSKYQKQLNIRCYNGPVRVCETCFNRP